MLILDTSDIGSIFASLLMFDVAPMARPDELGLWCIAAVEAFPLRHLGKSLFDDLWNFICLLLISKGCLVNRVILLCLLQYLLTGQAVQP